MKHLWVIQVVAQMVLLSGSTIDAQTLFFVGTTNADEAESVALCELDEKNESLKIVRKFHAGKRPGYLVLNENVLYTVSTANKGTDQHTLRAFQVLNDGQELKLMGEVSSMGLNPCHIAVGADGKSLYTANYSSGSIAQYAINSNGGLGSNQYFEQFTGNSVNQKRQEGPHAHYINTTIDNKFVLTADLGTDKVMIHQINDKGRMYTNESQPYIELPPGSGPRHLEFHPNNRWLYVLNELNSTLTSVKYENGTFKILDTVSTLPDDFQGTSSAAAVRIHPTGKYIYSSNRGSGSISVFEIDDQGKASMVQNFGAKLGWVRDFNLTSSGRFIIAGNLRSDEVVLLKLDRKGRILEYLNSIKLPSPSCLVFYNR
jgi:6-phosphogluconolactonase